MEPQAAKKKNVVVSEAFNASFGDFTLRSSDTTIFHFPRAILLCASKLLARKLKDESRSSSNNPVQIHADAHTLELLLTFIHPGLSNPPVRDIITLANLLRVATQYEMNSTLNTLRAIFTMPLDAAHPESLVMIEPLASLIIAHAYQYHNVARAALREVVKSNLGAEIKASRGYDIPLTLLEHIQKLREKRFRWLMIKIQLLSTEAMRMAEGDEVVDVAAAQLSALEAILVRPTFATLQSWYEEVMVDYLRAGGDSWKQMAKWEKEARAMEAEFPELPDRKMNLQRAYFRSQRDYGCQARQKLRHTPHKVTSILRNNYQTCKYGISEYLNSANGPCQRQHNLEPTLLGPFQTASMAHQPAPPEQPVVSETFHSGFGDFALQSSDGPIFYFPRTILQYSSKVFAAMFEIGTASPQDKTILIQSDSITLDLLLRFLHPAFLNPSVPNVDTLANLLRVTTQYEMDSTLHLLKIYFTTPFDPARTETLVTAEPLKALIISYLYNYRDIASVALREVVKSDLGAQLKAAKGYVIPIDLMEHIYTRRQELVREHVESIIALASRASDRLPVGGRDELDFCTLQIMPIRQVMQHPHFSSVQEVYERLSIEGLMDEGTDEDTDRGDMAEWGATICRMEQQLPEL